MPIDRSNRAAAIAALGGPENARLVIREATPDVPLDRESWPPRYQKEAAICVLALCALEDNGRALLRQFRAWVCANVDPADGQVQQLAEIDRLLSESPAAEPAEAAASQNGHEEQQDARPGPNGEGAGSSPAVATTSPNGDAEEQLQAVTAERDELRKRSVASMPMLERLREELGDDLGSGGGFVAVLNGIEDLRAQRDAAIAAQNDAGADEIRAAILRDVAELPDRTSPDDWPEAMVVTDAELGTIIDKHVGQMVAELRTLRSKLAEAEKQQPKPVDPVPNSTTPMGGHGDPQADRTSLGQSAGGRIAATSPPPSVATSLAQTSDQGETAGSTPASGTNSQDAWLAKAEKLAVDWKVAGFVNCEAEWESLMAHLRAGPPAADSKPNGGYEVLDRLLREAADAHYLCGEWHDPSDGDFNDLHRIAEAADAEIRRFVCAATTPDSSGSARLFHVQDGDRPMYVVARDWSAALDAWWRVIRAENEGVDDLEEPDGISMVARADELLIDGLALGKVRP